MGFKKKARAMLRELVVSSLAETGWEDRQIGQLVALVQRTQGKKVSWLSKFLMKARPRQSPPRAPLTLPPLTTGTASPSDQARACCSRPQVISTAQACNTPLITSEFLDGLGEDVAKALRFDRILALAVHDLTRDNGRTGAMAMRS